jgi:hypothetical protein
VHHLPPSAIDPRVRQFFEVFSTASGALDLDALARCFADPFLSADASGSRSVPRAAFLQALPRRAQMFADAGIGAANLTSLTCDRIDDHYLLARTEWSAPRTAGGEPVHMASSYLLHEEGDQLRIVLYLNHQGPPQAAA